MSHIRANNLGKKFGDLDVLEGLSFSVKRGELAVILGPSGCGKTTLLRILAGLIPHDGTVSVKSKKIGLIFQEPRLFPWMTVKENAASGVELQGKKAKDKDIDAILEKVGISDFKDNYPHQLSGGMKQRVALARALATKPGILLLDEPFASLDVATRKKFQDEILKLRDKKTTMVFVTHSIDEALKLGQKIIVLSKRPASIRATLKRGKGTKKRILELMG